MPENPNMIRVRLLLSPQDHRLLRIAAAEDNLPMSEMAQSLVLAALAKREKKKQKQYAPIDSTGEDANNELPGE